MRSGTWVTSWATAPSPDAVVARLAERGAIGVRGNHDAAALGGPEIEWFNPEARAGDRMDPRHDRPATRAWLAALPERREIESTDAGPRQPARSDLGVHHERGDRPGEPRSLDDDARAARPHPRADRLRARTAAGSGGRARPGSTLDLDGRRTLLNPGSVGQPRDGDPRASYLVLDPDAGDRDLAARRLRHRGRPGRHPRGAEPAGRLGASGLAHRRSDRRRPSG